MFSTSFWVAALLTLTEYISFSPPHSSPPKGPVLTYKMSNFPPDHFLTSSTISKQAFSVLKSFA